MNALFNYELEELEQLELTEETKERFKITDKEQLNWAFRKLLVLEQEQKEIDELAQKEINRITEWQDGQSKGITSSKLFFEGLITEYATSERVKNKEFKSNKTPYGVVRFKKQQDEYLYENEEEAIKYLEAYDKELVVVEKKPVKNEVKKRFTKQGEQLINTETGEVIPGIKVNTREDKIEIKVE